MRHQGTQLVLRVRSLEFHHGAHAEDTALDIVRVHVAVLQALDVASQGQKVVEGQPVIGLDGLAAPILQVAAVQIGIAVADGVSFAPPGRQP